MLKIVTVEINDETVVNVSRKMTFRMRDVERDTETMSGQIPGYALQMAAILQAVADPGEYYVWQDVDGGGEGLGVTELEGKLSLHDSADVEWKPAGGTIEGQVMASLEDAISSGAI